MAEIATTDAYGLYTKYLIDVYKDRIMPTNFLRSFFKVDVTSTKELSIEVQRGDEYVAVDVVRGTDGNRNQWSYSTEKIFIPPYFREYFDLTQLQLYDRLFGATTIEDAMFARLINDTADKVAQQQEKIERAIERNCAQVFETGIVELQAGINIDYKRKAESMVDEGAGQYFADNIDPFKKFENGADFLRKVGLSSDNVFNAILGTDALADLLANTKFTARQNLFNMALDQVTGPQRTDNRGATFHGIITAGSYKIQLWAYPQYFKHPTTGVKTPYLDPGLVVMLPINPSFKLGFAAVPQLLKPGQPVRKGAFIISEFTDEKAKTHEIHVESAPLPIPTAVDQIYTFRAKAA
jgi:hypothetical protein